MGPEPRARRTAELCERVEQHFRGFQVGRVEPFGKPLIDRLEERCRIGGTALIAPQPGQTGGAAQFPGQCLLPARPVVIFRQMIPWCPSETPQSGAANGIPRVLSV